AFFRLEGAAARERLRHTLDHVHVLLRSGRRRHDRERRRCHFCPGVLARQSGAQSRRLVFIGFVLGWQWAALRLIVGVALVFVLANLAARFVSPDWRPRGLAIRPDDDKRPFLLAWASAFFRLAVR